MNNKTLNLGKISNARGFIYGAAILLIILYHSALLNVLNVFTFFKPFLDIGVEIFFFLSGICLYFSFVKNELCLSFYKRRLIRVLPSYLVVYGIVFGYYNLYKDHNVSQFLINYSMLDFLLHGLGNVPWFLTTIIIFYLLYPLIYFIFFKSYKLKKLMIILFLALTEGLIIFLSVSYPHLVLATYRIPIFLLGAYVGKMVYEQKEISKKWLYLVIGALVITFIFYKAIPGVAGLKNLFYIPLTLMLIYFLVKCYFFNEENCKFLNKPFIFLGTISLEIYLTHEKIQENLFKILNLLNIAVNTNTVLYQLVTIALSIIISFGLKSLFDLIFYKRNKQNQLKC